MYFGLLCYILTFSLSGLFFCCFCLASCDLYSVCGVSLWFCQFLFWVFSVLWGWRNLSVGVCREFTASNCRCFGLCSALSCLFTVSARFCFLSVSQLALFHAEARASEGKSGMLSLWGIGGVGGSCFNSGLGWEKPTSFLLLPRVSRKMSLSQKVLSSLCLLYIYGFSLGPVARARAG